MGALAPPGQLSPRRSAALRGLRPRRDRLRRGPHGPAVVGRGAGARAGHRRTAHAAHHGGRGGEVLGKALAPSLSCVGGESARGDAFPALRNFGDGSARARRLRPGASGPWMGVRLGAGIRAGVSGRALRRRPRGRLGAGRGRARRRAAGGACGHKGEPHGAGAGGTGQDVMSPEREETPLATVHENGSEDTELGIEDPTTEAMDSGFAMDRRRLSVYALVVLVIIAALYFVLPKITETGSALEKIKDADPV